MTLPIKRYLLRHENVPTKKFPSPHPLPFPHSTILFRYAGQPLSFALLRLVNSSVVVAMGYCLLIVCRVFCGLSTNAASQANCNASIEFVHCNLYYPSQSECAHGKVVSRTLPFTLLYFIWSVNMIAWWKSYRIWTAAHFTCFQKIFLGSLLVQS